MSSTRSRCAAADDVSCIRGRGSAHRGQFALRWAQQNGKRKLLAEERDPRIELRNVRRNTRFQADVFAGFLIPSEGDLVGGGSGNARLRLRFEIE